MIYLHFNREDNRLIGFYTTDIWSVDDIPEPKVAISSEERAYALNINQTHYIDGEFLLIEEEYIATQEEVLENRKEQYANPITGSDVLFQEANRMKLMNEPGYEEKLEEAKARYFEIKEENPFPEEEK